MRDKCQRECDECGVSYLTHHFHANKKGNLCSSECTRERALRISGVTCSVCDKRFMSYTSKPRLTCSRECQSKKASYQNTVSCLACKKEWRRRTRTAMHHTVKCYHAYQQKLLVIDVAHALTAQGVSATHTTETTETTEGKLKSWKEGITAAINRFQKRIESRTKSPWVKRVDSAVGSLQRWERADRS